MPEPRGRRIITSGSTICSRTGHLWSSRKHISLFIFRLLGQTRPHSSAPPPLPRKENPRSQAPNCSSEGGRSTTHCCVYNIYCSNNPTGRWPHNFPRVDNTGIGCQHLSAVCYINMIKHGIKDICDICRVVYMSLWLSGQRELERREVLVLPPHGRVGWSFSLVWAFGESTRILIYVIRIVHKLPLKLIYVHYTTRNPALVLITKIMYICTEL